MGHSRVVSRSWQSCRIGALASLLALPLAFAGPIGLAAQGAAPPAPARQTQPAAPSVAPQTASQPTAPKPQPARRAFVRDDLAGNAVRLEGVIATEAARAQMQQAQQKQPQPGPAGQAPQGTPQSAQGTPATAPTADALMREATSWLSRNEPRRALMRAGSAIALSGKGKVGVPEAHNFAAWMLYARAALAVQADENARDRYEMRERATTAAYGAYQAARTAPEEARALIQLGSAFAAREMWRPALDAYAASLALVNDDGVRATYEDMRASHGFRIVNYKVESDSASPRVCFEMSDPLAAGRVDFAPFVAVAGASNAAVTANGQQLCVDGLKHGERYAIVVRQGLPSSVGETLLKNADYEIYVRDRAPQVRFTGRNYVLPRTGQEGIPVVTVNTAAVQVEVARVGDRGLLPVLRSDNFLSQLNRYDLDTIVEEKGTKVWSGQLKVASHLNRDEITAFPVQEALGAALQPGVYVMTARAAVDGVPAGGEDDSDYGQRATQWFVVSDIGLTALTGTEGVTVLVRSLASARPLAGVELKLIARNNEVLASRKSDASGVVRFDPGLSRGQGGLSPGLVTASGEGNDYGFLDLRQTPFDLSDRGVEGRAAPGPLDAFIFAERGVYRSGENVFLTAMLRDAKGVAVPRLPLTLVVKRPDGVEFKRALVEDQGLGGRALTLALLGGGGTGTWRVLAYADPKAAPIGETSFLVEDYVPERLEVTLSPKTKALRPGEPAVVDVAARYLFGAPGANLAISGEVVVSQAGETAVPGLAGYRVGIDDEEFESTTAEIEQEATTDAKGLARVEVPVAEAAAARPLQAAITLRVGEAGGRAVARSVTLPILPKGAVIGVKKLFTELSAGASASFDVVMAEPDGRRLAKPLTWNLYQIERRYQWYNSDGRWSSEAVESRKRVADGTLATLSDAVAKISAPVDWGSYRLEVAAEGASPALTSVSFTVGYSAEAQGADTPDVLDVKLDKAAYTSGEELKLRVNPRFAGTATLAIVGDRVYEERQVALPADGTTLSLPVKAEWGTGAYAVVFAHRPLDKAANRMPGRALGLSWFSIDRNARELQVTLDAPAVMRPRGPLTVPVKVSGLAAGEEAYVTLAAVDVGILNLTRYQTPNPQGFYFGQRQLATEVRDLYGYLIDGMQGTRGAIRSGGDAGITMEGDAPTQEPLARYSGVVRVGADGKASVTFDIPEFNGTVKLMASAWSKGRVGSASREVIVRDAVVLTGTAPRFLAIGDESRLFIQIDNVEAPAGSYALDLDVSGPVALAADAAHRRITLAAGGRATVMVPLRGMEPGVARIVMRLNGQGVDSRQAVALRVQPGTAAMVSRSIRPLSPGDSLRLTGDLFADLVPGTGRVSVAMSPLAAIDAPALLQALDRYPYGCTEQTVSRALPLLYVNKLAQARQLAIDPDLDKRITDAIQRVLARQGSSGSFGLWSVGGDDVWLDAYATDFLTRARERGFVVPQRPFDQALERLRNMVANAGEVTPGQGDGLAYAIYVLARNGRPVMGDLRYLADTKLGEIGTPLARAQIGAALAMLGDRGRSQSAFSSAVEALATYRDAGVSRPDYGSRLRDGAAVMALGLEAGAGREVVRKAGLVVDEAREATAHSSTQENAWMVLAAQAASAEAAGKGDTLSVDGEKVRGPLFRGFTQAELEQPVVIANIGREAARMVVSVSGNPLTPEGPASAGYGITRSYFHLNGSKADPAKVRQNERLVVVLRVSEQEARFARLLLVDRLPAGFEIDNPNLVDGASMQAFAWLKGADTENTAGSIPVATEYRDDRFVAAFDRDKGQAAFIQVAYIVRAVSPGRFVHPPASVEDMYRPDRYGRTGFGAVEVTATGGR